MKNDVTESLKPIKEQLFTTCDCSYIQHGHTKWNEHLLITIKFSESKLCLKCSQRKLLSRTLLVYTDKLKSSISLGSAFQMRTI